MRWISRILIWAGLLSVLVLLLARGAAMLRENQPLTEILPEEGRLVETSEGDIFVWEEGPEDAPMLLFAHGTAAWLGLWSPVLREMGTEGWRAVAFDMPPFGFSDRTLRLGPVPSQPCHSSRRPAISIRKRRAVFRPP